MNDPEDIQTLSRMLMVDEVCQRFEDAWKARQEPRIEQYLEAALPEDRKSLLGELLLLEWSK